MNSNDALNIIIISLGHNANIEDEMRDVKTKQQSIEGNYNLKPS